MDSQATTPRPNSCINMVVSIETQSEHFERFFYLISCWKLNAKLMSVALIFARHQIPCT